MAWGTRLREQAVEFCVGRQAQRFRTRRRKASHRERLAQTEQPQPERQACGVALEGPAQLAFEQAARHSTARMTLGHHATQPVVIRQVGQVIHRRWATRCRACGQLCMELCLGPLPGRRQRHTRRCRQVMHSEVSTARPGAGAEQALEICLVHEAGGHRAPNNRAVKNADKPRNSDSQPLAALGAARIDDGTTAARFHAHKEPVGTGAADLRGLIGTLHGELRRGLGFFEAACTSRRCMLCCTASGRGSGSPCCFFPPKVNSGNP